MPPERRDMTDLDDRDRDVLRVLADGRANPKLIRDETGLDKGDVNTVLNRLGRTGLTRQVTRGLYEITADGRTAIEASGGNAVDRDALSRALDDLERALKDDDIRAAKDVLDRVRDLVDEAE